MKNLAYGIFAITLLFGSSVISAADLPDLDNSDVRDSVDIRAFEIGDDGDVGILFYVVDRTTGNCFLLARDNYPGGITSVNCDSLKSIPMIKTYLETGTLGKKKKKKKDNKNND